MCNNSPRSFIFCQQWKFYSHFANWAFNRWRSFVPNYLSNNITKNDWQQCFPRNTRKKRSWVINMEIALLHFFVRPSPLPFLFFFKLRAIFSVSKPFPQACQFKQWRPLGEHQRPNSQTGHWINEAKNKQSDRGIQDHFQTFCKYLVTRLAACWYVVLVAGWTALWGNSLCNIPDLCPQVSGPVESQATWTGMSTCTHDVTTEMKLKLPEQLIRDS